MSLLLTLCLLATYISLGVPLSCETCYSAGNMCSGRWENCPPNEDSCALMQMEGSGLMQMKFVVKACLQSSICNPPVYSINLGKRGQMLTQTTCCKENKCPKIPPTMPRLNVTPNGKHCPACYALNSLKCEEETTDCAGDENYCFEISGTANMGGVFTEMVMKGCTSSAGCNRTQHSGSFGSVSVVAEASCIPATGAASSVLASFGFLLQAFTGLLFLKVLD